MYPAWHSRGCFPPERKITYNLRNPGAYPEKGSRTARFSNTYFQNVIAEWNLLNSDVRNSESLAAFKRKLISTVRPLKNSKYGVYDIIGVRRMTKLRIEFSPLNEHRFRHNFDCLSSICACECAIEDNQHFLLHCHLFSPMRIDLFGQLTDIPGLNITNLDSNALCDLLLFGSSQLNIMANRIILEDTIAFIDKRIVLIELHRVSQKWRLMFVKLLDIIFQAFPRAVAHPVAGVLAWV